MNILINLVITISILLASCVTPDTKKITVETDPPGAAILVNGAYVGDSPIQTTISSRNCVWVGFSYSHTGKRCELVLIQAQPKEKSSTEVLYTQYVNVDPDTMVSSKIFMNLRLEPVHPTQPYQIK